MSGSDRSRLAFLGTTEATSIEVSAEQLGPPGIQSELHVLAQMPDEHRSDADRLADSSSRRFKVHGKLSQLPAAAGAVNAAFTALDGDSYFVLPETIHALHVSTSGGSFYAHKNAKNEMSFIEFECIHERTRCPKPVLSGDFHVSRSSLLYTKSACLYLGGACRRCVQSPNVSCVYVAVSSGCCRQSRKPNADRDAASLCHVPRGEKHGQRFLSLSMLLQNPRRVARQDEGWRA